MFKFKRLLFSLTFRINITMFVLLGILGWGFAKTASYLLVSISNAHQCFSMSSVVTQSIDEHLLRIENSIKASALTSQTKYLTESNSRTFCDSVRSIVGVDSVYINIHRDEQPRVEKGLRQVWETGTSIWTEPHKDNSGNIVVTYLTPLQNISGKTYAVLCADMTLGWLDELAEKERTTERTVISVRSKDNIFIYHPEKDKMLHPADSADMAVTEESFYEEPLKKAFWNSNSTTTETVSEHTGWRIHCMIPARDHNYLSMIILGMSYFMFSTLFILMALCIMLVLRWYLHPLTKIADATEEISRGNFDVELPQIRQRTDVRQLRDNFVRMQHALKQYMLDLRSTTEQKVGMERDISIAAHIQDGMLPKDFNLRTDVDISGLLNPAKTVGGDLYDYFIRRSYTDRDGNHDYLFFIVGDVSGKGVPAALIMSVVCHLFRNISRRTTDAARICDSINIGLAEGNNENMFCTVFVGALDLVTGKLECCNAGHNPPIFVRDGKAEFMRPEMIQLPLGVDGFYRYKAQTIQLKKDDILFMYTDGVTEAENNRKELFGDEATLKAVKAASQSVSMKVLVANVLANVRNFVDGTEQSDDLTMLCMKRLEPKKERLKTVTEELEEEARREAEAERNAEAKA